jgi:hypothetical protein
MILEEVMGAVSRNVYPGLVPHCIVEVLKPVFRMHDYEVGVSAHSVLNHR